MIQNASWRTLFAARFQVGHLPDLYHLRATTISVISPPWMPRILFLSDRCAAIEIWRSADVQYPMACSKYGPTQPLLGSGPGRGIMVMGTSLSLTAAYSR